MSQFAIFEALIDFVSLSLFCVTSAVPWFFISDFENIREQDNSKQIDYEESEELI